MCKGPEERSLRNTDISAECCVGSCVKGVVSSYCDKLSKRVELMRSGVADRRDRMPG